MMFFRACYQLLSIRRSTVISHMVEGALELPGDSLFSSTLEVNEGVRLNSAGIDECAFRLHRVSTRELS